MTARASRSNLDSYQHPLHAIVDIHGGVSDTGLRRSRWFLNGINGGVASGVSFPGSGSNPFRVASLTGFDVPASGGELTATAAGQATADSGPQFGVLWIEIDGTGACGAATAPPGTAVYETVTTVFHNLVASNAAEVAAGAHRIDLCTLGLGTDSTTMIAQLNVAWSEKASGAGVASSSGGQSWQQLLAPYAGLLDN